VGGEVDGVGREGKLASSKTEVFARIPPTASFRLAEIYRKYSTSIDRSTDTTSIVVYNSSLTSFKPATVPLPVLSSAVPPSPNHFFETPANPPPPVRSKSSTEVS